jgi:hypothetical protein
MTRPDPDRRSGFSRLLEPEMIAALSAVLVGVCALVVSVVQVQMMYEQQHASVWPRVVIMPSYNPENGLSIHVSNPGIGPAVIQYVRASVDGAPRDNWRMTLAALLPNNTPDQFTWSTIGDRIIPPGEDVRALQISSREDGAAVLREIGRLEVEICYCSVYDRCWNIAAAFTGRSAPEEVARCPTAAAATFGN